MLPLFPPVAVRSAVVLSIATAAAAHPPPASGPHPPTAPLGPAPAGPDGRPLIDRADSAAGADVAVADRGYFGPDRGQLEFTLAGSGQADIDFERSAASFVIDANLYLTRDWSAGLRQSVGLVERDDDPETSLSTSLFTQYHFGRGQLRPFVGVAVGYSYGEEVSETFFGGPEVGTRFYLQRRAFLFARVSYDVLLNNDEGDEGGTDGRLLSSFGVGFSF